MPCTSAFIIREKNEFKNQSGVTVVQSSKMEPGGHSGCGFRCVPESLRTRVFWTISNSRIPPAVLKTISASSHLMVSRSPLVTVHPFHTPTNPCLTSTLASCQLQLEFLINNLYNFAVFAFMNLPHFVVQRDAIQALLESVSPGL